MRKDRGLAVDPAGLRHRAEELLARKPAARKSMSEPDLLKLVHELEVHQIELTLQNEELLRARAEAEEAKARAEASYNELYDFAPVGYLTLGVDGKIHELNLTGAGMLGLLRAQLKGRRFGSFVAPECRVKFADFLQRVFLRQRKESCTVTVMKAGEVTVITYLEAAAEESGSTCRAVMVDITSTQQAETALRQINERLNHALAIAHMGVWEWDYRSNEIFWSPECCGIFGVERLCVKLETIGKLLGRENTTRAMVIYREIIASKVRQSAEFPVIRPDGKTVWIYAEGQIESGENGEPQRLFGIVRDETERRQV